MVKSPTNLSGDSEARIRASTMTVPAWGLTAFLGVGGDRLVLQVINMKLTLVLFATVGNQCRWAQGTRLHLPFEV